MDQQEQKITKRIIKYTKYTGFVVVGLVILWLSVPTIFLSVLFGLALTNPTSISPSESYWVGHQFVVGDAKYYEGCLNSIECGGNAIFEEIDRFLHCDRSKDIFMGDHLRDSFETSIAITTTTRAVVIDSYQRHNKFGATIPYLVIEDQNGIRSLMSLREDIRAAFVTGLPACSTAESKTAHRR